jgi:hypothetical protein
MPASDAEESIRGVGAGPSGEGDPAAALRGRQFLGREFLTWLLWRTETEGPDFELGDDLSVRARFGDRLVLRALAGEVTESVHKGMDPATAADVRCGLARGGTVHEARVVIERGEREWQVVLTSGDLDFKGVKLPAVLSQEDDDRFAERIYLIEELEGIVTAVYGAFLDARLSPSWKRRTLPAMREWITEAMAGAVRRLGGEGRAD